MGACLSSPSVRPAVAAHVHPRDHAPGCGGKSGGPPAAAEGALGARTASDGTPATRSGGPGPGSATAAGAGRARRAEGAAARAHEAAMGVLSEVGGGRIIGVITPARCCPRPVCGTRWMAKQGRGRCAADGPPLGCATPLLGCASHRRQPASSDADGTAATSGRNASGRAT